MRRKVRIKKNDFMDIVCDQAMLDKLWDNVIMLC